MKENLYRCEVTLKVKGPVTLSVVNTRLTTMAHTPEEACSKIKESLDISIISVSPKLVEPDFMLIEPDFC